MTIISNKTWAQLRDAYVPFVSGFLLCLVLFTSALTINARVNSVHQEIAVKTLQVPTPVRVWTTVARYTGKNDAETPVFIAYVSEWRLRWTCNPASFYGEYDLIIDAIDTSGDTFNNITGAVNIVCKPGQVGGFSALIRNWTGTFFLNVISEGTWQINVEEFK